MVELYAATTDYATNASLMSYVRRNTDTAGRNNERDLAREIEGQAIFS